MTRAELFAGRAGDEARVRELLAPMHEVDVDRGIAERAGVLRRSLRILMPDALIVATALVRGVPLVTRNRRDYEMIEGLILQDTGGGQA